MTLRSSALRSLPILTKRRKISLDNVLCLYEECGVNTNPANANFPTGQCPDREAAREERRLRRIAVLEQVCDITVQAVERLGKYINAELSEIESEPFARLADPCTALTRLTQSVRRIVALQERLDEDDETREKRLKAERAERERAIQAREVERRRAAGRDAFEEKKEAIRRAVRKAHRDVYPDETLADREHLLDDLFRDYEDHFNYEGDPVQIVTELCAELDIEYDPNDFEGGATDPVDPAGGESFPDPLAPRAAANGHDPP